MSEWARGVGRLCVYAEGWHLGVLGSSLAPGFVSAGKG